MHQLLHCFWTLLKLTRLLLFPAKAPPGHATQQSQATELGIQGLLSPSPIFLPYLLYGLTIPHQRSRIQYSPHFYSSMCQSGDIFVSLCPRSYDTCLGKSFQAASTSVSGKQLPSSGFHNTLCLLSYCNTTYVIDFPYCLIFSSLDLPPTHQNLFP